MLHNWPDLIHDVKEACEYFEKVIEDITKSQRPRSSEHTCELGVAIKGLKDALKIKHMYIHMTSHPDHAEQEVMKTAHVVTTVDKRAAIAARHNPY